MSRTLNDVLADFLDDLDAYLRAKPLPGGGVRGELRKLRDPRDQAIVALAGRLDAGAEDVGALFVEYGDTLPFYLVDALPRIADALSTFGIIITTGLDASEPIATAFARRDDTPPAAVGGA